MDGIADVLADALKVHGASIEKDVVLEGRSGEVLTVPLLVSIDERSVLVWPSGPPQGDLAALREDLGADGILVVDLDATQSTEGPVAVWDRDRLARTLGDALLAECGLPLRSPLLLSMWDPPRPPAPTPQRPAPRMLFQGRGADPGPAPSPDGEPATFQLPWDDALPLSADLPEAPAPAPPAPSGGPSDLLWDIDGTTAPSAPTDPSTGLLPEAFKDPTRLDPWDLDATRPAPLIRRLPVRITPRAAQESVAGSLAVADYHLVLHPVHLFDAEVETFRKGSLDSVREHVRIQVHATDRNIEIVDPALVDPSAPDLRPPDHDVATEERSLRIHADRAAELAREWLRQAYTRVVEVPASDGDLYAYSERDRVGRGDDQLLITPRGLFHRPVWRLAGSGGSVDVDAMTGHAVASQISYPDAMLLE